MHGEISQLAAIYLSNRLQAFARKARVAVGHTEKRTVNAVS